VLPVPNAVLAGMLEPASCGLSMLGSAGPWRPLGPKPLWAARIRDEMPPRRTALPPPRWSSSTTCAHAVVVSVLTPAEMLIAARRLAGARPHLAAVAGMVHHDELWQLCRDELTGVDVRIDGWDIRGRWFGVVVGATPRLGELRRGETIPWRVIASLIARRGRRGSR